ncbi:uncharacterized protein LOC122872151 [Siniperca chuatsi]|uniref:uncharacterized protein LOC122872151 n=1 Tax=Siniperca chuatsi TaxID=119488 RepID=UPI001CE1FD92|nr:uncharacterized protein LOC122872151 [Siniperca chuatsi]
MRSQNLFLLVYLVGCSFGASRAQSNATCTTGETCGQVSDSTSHFLQCVGLPSTDTGRDYMQRLKGMLEATMDVYTFMRSSMTGVPLLSLEEALALNPGADPLQNEALIQMWMEVKIKPLLQSITKHSLSCLSTKNFSCSTYQTVVRELSDYYSEMNPVRQKWIYTFFMYPFLSGDRVAGCVSQEESSEEWLMKNFGAFRAMARIKDFSTLNMVFSGLEVLHLLTPVQKAELLLRPTVSGLDNGTLSLVFNSLLTGDSGLPPITIPGEAYNWTSPENPPTYPPQPTYNPYPPPSPNRLRQVINGFMMALRPIRSFVHDFVSFTQERNMSEIRSTTLTQFLLNFTLAELADMYRPQNTSVDPERPTFDVTNVEDWYQQVVMPVLRRFLPNDEALMQQNITLVFYQVFYLDHSMDNETFVDLDVCSITLDKNPCGLTDAVENVAYVLHCAARTNLTMSEATIMSLIVELTEHLNSLIKELSTANFNEVASDFQQIFVEADSPSLTQEHLEDPNFIELWFQIKLMPLLPDISTGLLSCLSTKNFSCPVYQTIVAALSKHMSFMDADPMYSHNIYEHFIYSFLLHHNTSDPQCISSANHSAEWLKNNFGFFSRFAFITDFYKLNPNFSGLEVLQLLSPKQTAEMLLLPLPTPPEKDFVIKQVFDFLLESPEDRKLPEVLHSLIELAKEVNPPCSVYKPIFERLYGAKPYLPLDMEPVTWAVIDDLINIAPEECVPENIVCAVTQSNGTNICKGINSSDLHSYMKTSMEVSCNFTLETYACAQLENFTANQLVSLLKCNLPGNSSHSKVLWKMLLTKLSFVLDPALDILANMSMTMVGPSATEVLDVIGEIRVSMLTDEQLMNSSVIRKWFSGRLSRFLPSASGMFLRCLSRRNLSCHSYQQILQVFIHHFDDMTSKQQHVVFQDFILRFLSHSGSGCVSFSNGSAEWLIQNLGPFSAFLSLNELLHLNPHFNPLEVLQLLTPKQSAELLVLTDKDVIINMIFDYLTESPDKGNIPEFLFYLVMFLKQGNLSCSSYKTLFTRLDLAMATVSLDVASSITYSKMTLSMHIPPGCIIYVGECNVTMANETDICVGVNSTMLQLHLDSGRMNGSFCDFALEEFACASLSALKAEDLTAMLACSLSSNSSGSRPVWKLLLSKASHVLDEALDLLTDTTLDPRNPAVSMVLDSIREIRLDTFSMASLNDPAFIQLWFKRRLRPFLPAVSPEFLSCLTTKELNCSTYQHIIQILSDLQPQMTLPRQMSVYTHFIKVFLTKNNTEDPSCSLHINNSGEWLQKNLGGFSVLVSFQDLQMLYLNFSAMEALPQLTVRQLAEVSATPGQLTSPTQVTMVMKHIPNQFLPAFFDDFSPAITANENMLPSPVRSAMLEVVFDRANLSDPSVGDSVVLLWLNNRLRPLLVNLSPLHVAPFFRILAERNCSIQQQGVEDLNSTITSLNEVTQKKIHNQIIQALKGPIPLQCYGDNYNHSFYSFLERSFLGFQFPNLTTFLSLIPHNRMHQLVNSMPPSALGNFLRRPDIVDNDAELCVIYNNYIQTPIFLETESLPAVVRRPTLPCVWPVALSSSNRSEVNAWFDRRLHNYLVFLTKSLISPNTTHNASCLAFQKLISVLGEYNYTVADFKRQDMFNTIRAYLTSAMAPRCYNPSDPELNSTAWFAEYIGPFMPFLTLEDLQTFGSAQVIQVFTVNLLNIALLNHSALPLNLTNYYTELVYQQDSNFNPLLLPLLCRCVVPGPAFSQLTAEESMIVLHNLTTLCTSLDPQVSAALAGNFGDNIDARVIFALGSESTGLSTHQIMMIKPQDLFAALGTLSSVIGWNKGQANAIIQSLMSSGILQINSASSLFVLGSLVVGVPVTTFSSINGSQLLTASKNPSFMGHMMSAPQIVQQTFVTQIISVNSNSETMIQNVPDELATEIPRVLLLGFSNTGSVITTVNKKKWKRQQAELFFNVIAVESATTVLGSPDNLSSSVLQGFTCTGVRTIQKVQIKKLIKACRRKGRNKVTLVETQLTCMYNYIKGDSDATSFDLYPSDILLYYDYSLVPQASCRSYFEQLADADFSVFSSALSYKLTALFANARSCLGITNTSLTEDNISVLGNMCCTLDGSFIENSDPSILEKLKNCPDLTGAQVTAVEALLQSGKTQYGSPSTWNGQTLKDLGMLPLYLTSTFYNNFDKKTKRTFLRYFLTVIRSNGVDRQKRRRLKNEIRDSIINKSKRSIVNECTVGKITQVTISDETFPFDYNDITQFNCCLSATTVKDNLDSITGKVDQEEYLKIVLSKLREAYPANSTIPEGQVQLLGPASRVATIDDINMWSITKIDTLSALMDASNGQWDPSLAKAIISKYLSKEGNKLGSAELNTIGGANLCSVDTNVLKSISQQSLKEADALTVSSCTTEKKKELFTIARQAFETNTRSTVSTTSYQLTKPYVGGADLEYVRSLAASNITMDMATFTSLDKNVVLNLTVNEVRGLLGTNLADLKTYENQTLVQSWISRQPQSQLDMLGVGFLAGRVDLITSTASTTHSNSTATSSSSSSTTTGSRPSSSTAGSSTTTGNNGAHIRSDAGFSFLVVLALLIASQHILV